MPELDDLTELQVDSDSALFDGAMAETPVETPDTPEAPASETPADTGEQPRDESGRFAAKPGDTPAEVVTPTAVTTPTEPEGGNIPAWRLREEAENRRAAEARAQQFERELAELRRNPPKPQEPPKAEEKPDPLLNPEAYEAYLERKFESRFRAERGEISLRSAKRAYGETFDKAYQAVQSSDQATRDRIANSPDPGEELVAWHREREMIREVGSDPAAYKNRLLEDAVKDPAFQAKVVAAIRAQQSPTSVPAGNRPSPVRLPPSLSTVTPSGSAIGAGDDDVSDEGLFAYANG